MKKIPLNQIKKKINLKRFLEIAGPSSNYGEKICRSGIFESVALASLGNILLEELNTKDIKKLYKVRKLYFGDYSHVFDFKSLTSNFKLIKEIDFTNKKKNTHFFLECLYSKIDKNYYITLEQYFKLEFPGDDFFFKSKSKLKCLKTLDIMKEKLLKTTGRDWTIRI